MIKSSEILGNMYGCVLYGYVHEMNIGGWVIMDEIELSGCAPLCGTNNKADNGLYSWSSR